MKVSDWLNSLGMSEYVHAFEANRIEFNQLHDLTDAHLREIGVSALGDRLALLKAAAASEPDLSLATMEGVHLHAASERRHLTILFLDVVGSTALSTETDAEALSDTIGAFHRLAAAQIHAFEGYVAQSFGDGLLAYFGWPIAHEDDAQRAVLAADAAHRSLRDLSDPAGARLMARAGIATGWVVLGDIGGTAKTEVIGETPNLAARLQSVARPGQTVVAAATADLLGDGFELDNLGPQSLKGFENSPMAYAVTAITQQPRFQRRVATGSTQLIGRKSEVTLLDELWSRTQRGAGQIITLTGEAGIGKTRMIREFLNRVASERHFVLRYHCSPYYQNTALKPVIVQLSETSGFAAQDNSTERLQKLTALLQPTDAGTATASLIAELLGVQGTGDYAPLEIPAAQKRQRIFSSLIDQLLRLSDKAPVIAIVEDAHWIDPTTAEYLGLAARSIARSPILIVVTGRPEYHAPQEWQHFPNASHFTVKGLSEDEAERLAIEVAGAPLPPSVLKEVIAKTDGVPLFIEEFTKSLAESGCLQLRDGRYELVASLPHSIVPASLQDSLMARLDKLPAAKVVAQVAAAIGREFTLELLAGAASLTHAIALDRLKELEASGLLFERRFSSETTFVFKHALVQNAAYESLLQKSKRRLHDQIATVLERDFPKLCDAEPEVVAAHWSRSERPDISARYWLKAGQNALKRSAYSEAMGHLGQGLRFVRVDSHEASNIKFNLHLCMGQVLTASNGPAAPATINAYTSALELIDNVADTELRFDLLYGIFSGYHFASKFSLARVPAEKMLDLAVAGNDDGHRCQAHRMLGYLSFFEGKLDDALAQFHSLRSLYVPTNHAQMAVRYGADSLVSAQGFEAVVRGVRGERDLANALISSNVAYARQLKHPPTLGWAFASSGYLSFFLSEPELHLPLVIEGARYCAQNNVAVWGTHCKIFERWANAVAGKNVDDEIREIGLLMLNARSGTTLGLPMFRAMLAELYLRNGMLSEAQAEIVTAASDLQETGQRFFASTVFFVQGEVEATRGHEYHRTARQKYELSASEAHKMGATLLEHKAGQRLSEHKIG